MIQNLGQGTLLGKADVKGAFRLMIISPVHFPLLGFQFDGNYYFDRCLPFGLSYSCALWEKGTSRQRSGKGAIRKRFPLQKPRWEKKPN